MVIDQIVKDNYSLINGDCIQVMKDLPDNSIHYSIFSPPFAELYTYSDNIEDLGNSKDYNQFFVGFNFVISELHRIIKEGRLVTVHCIDIPAMKERDGYIGLKDFPGDIIREFQKAGFIYHSRCTIWKNPLIEATRTKALGLMHKQLCKDSAMCRQGLPDYVLTFRKKGENKEPINNGDGLKQFRRKRTNGKRVEI
jgi:DNA modification methylase